MMPLMMTCRDQPAACYPFNYEPRENFPAHVICHAHYRHNGQNDSQSADMNGDEENEQWNHDRERSALRPDESSSRPRRSAVGCRGERHGRGGTTRGRCIQPVRPVKPRIVRETDRGISTAARYHKGKAGDIGVDQRPAMIVPTPGDDAGGNAVNRRAQERPVDLTADLRAQPRIEAGAQRGRSARRKSRSPSDSAARQSASSRARRAKWRSGCRSCGVHTPVIGQRHPEWDRATLPFMHSRTGPVPARILQNRARRPAKAPIPGLVKLNICS